MPMNELNIIVILVLFFATLVRSTFGFGDAVIAMPILVMVIGIKTATPLVALVAPVISFLILVHNWQKIQIKSLLPLIISTLIGIPIGLLFLEDVNEKVVKIVLAISIILFSIFKLINWSKLHLKTDRFAPVFGLISGILGGAYNTNGPTIVIYGSLRRWDASNFRIILQGIFFPTNILILTSHAIAGLWTWSVWQYYLWAFPFILLGIFLGSRINKRIPAERFINYVNGFLLILGIMLLVKTI